MSTSGVFSCSPLPRPGLRVSETCSLTPHHALWQQESPCVSGKGGSYGNYSKERKGRVVIPAGVPQSWIEPFRGVMQKPPCSATAPSRSHNSLIIRPLAFRNCRRSVCAGEAGSHAGESPAGRIRRFTTERDARNEAARPKPQAGHLLNR